MPRLELYLYECKLCKNATRDNQTCYLLQTHKETPLNCPLDDKLPEWNFKGEKTFVLNGKVY